MNRKCAIYKLNFCFIAVFFVGILFIAVCPTSADDSLIKNGGFENGLASWEVYNAKLSPSAADPRTGSGCVTGWVPAHQAKLSSIRQRLQLEPGAEYEITFWARSDDGESAGAVWADYETDSDNRMLLVTKKIPTDWTDYKIRFRARRPDTSLDFHVPQTWAGTGGANAGRAWIDDISVRRCWTTMTYLRR